MEADEVGDDALQGQLQAARRELEAQQAKYEEATKRSATLVAQAERYKMRATQLSAGEAALRAVFREASRGSGSFSSKKRVADEEEEGGERGEPRGPAPSYTIVRPSGLLDGPGRGPAATSPWFVASAALLRSVVRCVNRTPN